MNINLNVSIFVLLFQWQLVFKSGQVQISYEWHMCNIAQQNLLILQIQTTSNRLIFFKNLKHNIYQWQLAMVAKSCPFNYPLAII